MNVNVDIREGSAERLSRMIQLPTVSAELDSRGTGPFDAFVSLLEELYPLIHANLARERITDFGLLYRWPGALNSSDPVVLMAHYDVVPAEARDGWKHDPFAGVIEGGFVHGRGALDDKGPLLVTLEAVENLLAAGYTPARDVYVSLGGNEESYGTAAKAIAATLRDRGIVPWLVLDEGGAVVDAPLPGVKVDAAMVGVGEKGSTTLRLSAKSDGGHASTPPALTAVGRVSRGVARLTPQTFTASTPAAVTTMLGTFSEHAWGPIGWFYKLLANSPWLTARVFSRLGGEPAALVRTTVAPTMMTGGTAQNVLPSHAEAIINLRLALGETPEGAAKRVRRRIGDRRVRVDIVEGGHPSPESRTDIEQFELITRAVGASHPEAITVPYVMMAATDSRHFHEFAPACFRFAPLAMNNEQRAAIHGVGERVAVSELARGEQFHRALITSIPGPREQAGSARQQEQSGRTDPAGAAS